MTARIDRLMGTLLLSTLTTGCALDPSNPPWQSDLATEEVVQASQGGALGDSNANDVCYPELLPKGAWLAADGGQSVPLPNGTSIHLFGDTMLGPTGADDTRERTFVGNSIGLGRCAGPDFDVDYVWRDDGVERGAFFDTHKEGVRLWPVDGFLVGGSLHVVLAKITETSEGLGFAYDGAALASIDNPLDAPLDWSIRYQTLSDSYLLRPVQGIAVDGGYVHFFSEIEVGTYPQPAGLTRLPLDAIDQAAERLEYLASDGAWKPMSDFDKDAREVLSATSTTTNPHYHDGLGKWMLVQADSQFGSPDAVLRTADTIEGPWSEPHVVFRFQEMLREDAHEKGIICYAVTEHPQHRLDEGSTVLVTYACNTLGTVVPAVQDLGLYHPKSVLLDLGSIATPD